MADRSVIPRTLPRGPHRLAREVVLASQRGRLLEAMAEEVAEKGFAATSVAGVIARAGVSRKTFYELFRDKEACFLEAYETVVEVLLATVGEAAPDADDPVARLRAGVREYLNALSAEPAFARTFLLEVAGAGPAALERRRQVHRQFAAQLQRQSPVPLADELALAIVGATNELVSTWVEEGRGAELPALEDTLVRIHVALVGAGAG